MITASKTKQNWTIGQTVRIGFMTVYIADIIPTPGDGRPDVYVCTSQDGTKFYTFTPHFGIQAASSEDISSLRDWAKSKLANQAIQTIASIPANDSPSIDSERIHCAEICRDRLNQRMSYRLASMRQSF